MRSLTCAFAVSLGFLLGCGAPPLQLETYGLTTFAVEVASENLAQLTGNYRNKASVPAVVDVNGAHFRIDIACVGATSIEEPKKNWRLRFSGRDRYRGYQTLRLSNQSKDPSILRSALGFYLYRLAGLMVPYYEPVVVYINKKFLGLYLLLEPVDSNFFARRGIEVEGLYKAHHNGVDPWLDPRRAYAKRDANGSWADMENLLQVLNDQPTADDVASVLELESFLTYLSVSRLIKHHDGLDNNYVLFRSRRHQRFGVVPWDLDRILPKSGVLMGHGYLGTRVDMANAVSRTEERWRQQVRSPDMKSALLTYLKSWVDRIQEAHRADPMLRVQVESLEDEAHWLVDAL